MQKSTFFPLSPAGRAAGQFTVPVSSSPQHSASRYLPADTDAAGSGNRSLQGMQVGKAPAQSQNPALTYEGFQRLIAEGQPDTHRKLILSLANSETLIGQEWVTDFLSAVKATDSYAQLIRPEIFSLFFNRLDKDNRLECLREALGFSIRHNLPELEAVLLAKVTSKKVALTIPHTLAMDLLESGQYEKLAELFNRNLLPVGKLPLDVMMQMPCPAFDKERFLDEWKEAVRAEQLQPRPKEPQGSNCILCKKDMAQADMPPAAAACCHTPFHSYCAAVYQLVNQKCPGCSKESWFTTLPMQPGLVLHKKPPVQADKALPCEWKTASTKPVKTLQEAKDYRFNSAMYLFESANATPDDQVRALEIILSEAWNPQAREQVLEVFQKLITHTHYNEILLLLPSTAKATLRDLILEDMINAEVFFTSMRKNRIEALVRKVLSNELTEEFLHRFLERLAEQQDRGPGIKAITLMMCMTERGTSTFIDVVTSGAVDTDKEILVQILAESLSLMLCQYNHTTTWLQSVIRRYISLSGNSGEQKALSFLLQSVLLVIKDAPYGAMRVELTQIFMDQMSQIHDSARPKNLDLMHLFSPEHCTISELLKSWVCKAIHLNMFTQSPEQLKESISGIQSTVTDGLFQDLKLRAHLLRRAGLSLKTPQEFFEFGLEALWPLLLKDAISAAEQSDTAPELTDKHITSLVLKPCVNEQAKQNKFDCLRVLSKHYKLTLSAIVCLHSLQEQSASGFDLLELYYKEWLKDQAQKAAPDRLCTACTGQLPKHKAAMAALLPCNHKFHEACLQKHLHINGNTTCPRCKVGIVKVLPLAQLPATGDKPQANPADEKPPAEKYSKTIQSRVPATWTDSSPFLTRKGAGRF